MEALLVSSALSTGTVWEFPFEDGLVLARPNLPALFILNHTGASLWRALCIGMTVEETARDFHDRFDVPFEVASADIKTAIEDWNRTIINNALCAENDVQPEELLRVTEFGFEANYRINGRGIRLRIAEPDLVDEIAPRLEHLVADPTQECWIAIDVFRSAGRICAVLNGNRIVTESTPSAARTVLLQEIIRATNADSDWLAVLHAGVCATGAGSILVAGASHSGKTTLIAGLLGSGFQACSDDCAPITRNGRNVVPMPFAFMVREGSWDCLERRVPELKDSRIFERTDGRVRFVDLATCGDASSRVATPRAIVFPRFEAGGETRIVAIDPLDCLFQLQRSGFWVPHDRESISEFLEWVGSIDAYEMSYSDLDAAAMAIGSILREPHAAR
jgi:hypothetical protein